MAIFFVRDKVIILLKILYNSDCFVATCSGFKTNFLSLKIRSHDVFVTNLGLIFDLETVYLQ